MKYRIILTALIASISLSAIAQPAGKNIYPLVVSFQSECCGVPADSALRNFINSFKKQYKVKKITAYHIGPLGREGEYDLAFKLNELSKKQAVNFISRIKNIKKLSTDKGLWTFKEKEEIDAATIPKSEKVVF